jgi:hypothetical protein
MKIQSTQHWLSYKGVLLLLFAVSVRADEGPTIPTLKHNPFAVPALVAAAALAPGTDTEGTDQSANTVQQDMNIRAVLVSKTGTLVNINGSIVGLHEVVDGYELISLDSEKAVLSRDGNELVLGFPHTSNTGGPDPH